MTFLPTNSSGLFLDPTLIIPEEGGDDLLYTAKDKYEQIADAVNVRECSLYPLSEIENGQEWFTVDNPQRYRDGWRLVVQMPDFPGGGTGTAVSHGIQDLTDVTHRWGKAINGTEFVGLDYVDEAGTGNIRIFVDATTVQLIGGATSPALTQVYVILEYIRGVG